MSPSMEDRNDEDDLDVLNVECPSILVLSYGKKACQSLITMNEAAIDRKMTNRQDVGIFHVSFLRPSEDT